MFDMLRDVNQPIELGSLTVGDAGHLVRGEPRLPIAFGFDWREVRFQGEVDRTEGGLLLRLSADMAVVPFSAEDTARRTELLSLLKAGGGHGAGICLSLSPNNRLVLSRELRLPKDASLTAQTLVTQTAAALLNSAHYLDLMVEFGLVEREKS
ncbi:MAG: hypothetical protein AB7P52_10350 [Alphaproteobacteria bacterium]